MKKILVIILPILVCGCGAATKLDAVRNGFNHGTPCAAASKFTDQNICTDNIESTGPDVAQLDNLGLLISGDALFQNNNLDAGDRIFEESNRRNDGSRTSIGREATKLIAGQMASEYKPYFMDDLFVSYYQVWAALLSNRYDDARVIINQSYAKQQKVAREFSSLIKNRKNDSSGLVEKIQDENKEWRVFSDIMNPALTYLAGLYFLNFATSSSDYDTAAQYLARVNGMAPGGYVSDDLAAARAGRRPTNTAWIFVETGFAPKLYERRIDWPVITPDGTDIISFAMADAKLLPGFIRPDGFDMVADVDSMFLTEFNEYKINETLRAFAAASARAALQSSANDNWGAFGNFGATVYSMATTNADVRSWVTLPKHVFIKRIKKDKTGMVKLTAGSHIISEINLPPSGNSMVYIRLTNGLTTPKIVNIK